MVMTIGLISCFSGSRPEFWKPLVQNVCTKVLLDKNRVKYFARQPCFHPGHSQRLIRTFAYVGFLHLQLEKFWQNNFRIFHWSLYPTWKLARIWCHLFGCWVHFRTDLAANFRVGRFLKFSRKSQGESHSSLVSPKCDISRTTFSLRTTFPYDSASSLSDITWSPCFYITAAERRTSSELAVGHAPSHLSSAQQLSASICWASCADSIRLWQSISRKVAM